ncbi:MAG: ribosome small subunit-dependent GTPase A [Thermoanaerobacteraceae bacterium]|nr:ribosome small subunit-dependent GTPase A [Thermoanaerobacteraceae bacterium]
MAEGIILKGYSGFYYVQTGDGQVVECSLRGRFRQKKVKFLPGDRVEISVVDEKRGVIEELLPRETELLRPPVANVDQVILVTSLEAPPPDLVLLDRLLVFVEHISIMPVICFNKIDIADKENSQDIINIYDSIGYPVVITSAKTGEGIEKLSDYLDGHITVLAGPSGAGKSSILNALNPEFQLQTGKVSEKVRRGRHTTRHTELLPLNKGLVADTPGFSRINLPDIPREELSFLFPEMDVFRDRCRFNTCLHDKEPDCGVKEAVRQGKISRSRYENYLQFLEEIIEQERSY